MTIKYISKTFFAKLTKFQKNTKTSVRDSDSVNVNVCNYAKNNDNGPIVLMKGITCRFGNLIANQNITFDLKKGESTPFLPPDIPVYGFIYDVKTGKIERVSGNEKTLDEISVTHS